MGVDLYFEHYMGPGAQEEMSKLRKENEALKKKIKKQIKDYAILETSHVELTQDYQKLRQELLEEKDNAEYWKWRYDSR